MTPLERVRLAKSGTSLVDVIGMTLTLRRVGRWRVACCPFHGEKTPSFYVYDDHYHCFGCGAHGDAVDWIMRVHGLGFVDALQCLDGGSVPPAFCPESVDGVSS